MTQTPGAGHAEFNASCMHDLTELTAVVEQVCQRAGADVDELFSVRLAVEEVFTNIVQYGYGGGIGPINVDIDAQPERLRITLADAAPPFDPGTVVVPSLDAPLDQRGEGGWGWHFVREVMDQVEWAEGTEGGNRFTLVKWLRHSDSPIIRSVP
ncbi:MAG: ATP-binding protein [Rhodanobacter sp.]